MQNFTQSARICAKLAKETIQVSDIRKQINLEDSYTLVDIDAKRAWFSNGKVSIYAILQNGKVIDTQID